MNNGSHGSTNRRSVRKQAMRGHFGERLYLDGDFSDDVV